MVGRGPLQNVTLRVLKRVAVSNWTRTRSMRSNRAYVIAPAARQIGNELFLVRPSVVDKAVDEFRVCGQEAYAWRARAPKSTRTRPS